MTMRMIDHSRLTRRLPLPVRQLCAALLLAPLVGVALGAAMRSCPSSPRAVYTVAALTDRLASKHTAWIGRTVWVRGEVVARLNRLDQSHVQLGLNNLASAVGLRLKSHGKRRTLKCLRRKRFTLSLAQR